LNPAAASFSRTRGAELVTQIEETTRAGLQAIIERAFQEGSSPAELAGEIRDSYEFSEARSEMIARTELAFAHVQGTLEGWRESGVVNGKSVILSNDHPEADECDDAAELGVVPLEDDFGGLGDPPFHPFCECDELPEVIASADESD
jgi:SPP1 gp7 family putative phage head morphogenesis protein